MSAERNAAFAVATRARHWLCPRREEVFCCQPALIEAIQINEVDQLAGAGEMVGRSVTVRERTVLLCRQETAREHDGRATYCGMVQDAPKRQCLILVSLLGQLVQGDKHFAQRHRESMMLLKMFCDNQLIKRGPDGLKGRWVAAVCLRSQYRGDLVCNSPANVLLAQVENTAGGVLPDGHAAPLYECSY
jgi:hypothetical protein